MSWSEAVQELVDRTPPPHCDQAVLHAPGVCRHCDQLPQWQALRELWGVAFTGERPSGAQISCPSDFRRGLGAAGQHWPGNRIEPPSQ